jgi:hypothetical protein
VMVGMTAFWGTMSMATCGKPASARVHPSSTQSHVRSGLLGVDRMRAISSETYWCERELVGTPVVKLLLPGCAPCDVPSQNVVQSVYYRVIRGDKRCLQ